MKAFLAWKSSAPRWLPVASRFLSRLLLVLAALELVYVVAANAFLRSGKLREFVNSSDDVKIEFERASSPWPGRIHVNELSFRLEDYNVQFLITIERADFDLHLLSLLRRSFHAEDLDAHGVSFRMRHKVERVDNARRLAAYPPIPGFSEPPLYRGPKPPPIPDAEYDLWQVRIDDVVARVRELWALEYRYQGGGVARGSFMVRPSRGFEVTAATLELAGGRLTTAERAVAERLNARISFDAPYNDTRGVNGMAVLKRISATLRGHGRDGDLGFLDLYLEPNLGLRAGGRLDLDLDVRMRQGTLEPNTRADAKLRDATFAAPHSSFTGDIDLAMLAPATTDTLEFGFSSERIRGTDHDGIPGPKFEGVTARIALAPRALSESQKVTETTASLHSGEVPALGWFEPWLGKETPRPKLDGSLRFALHFGHRADGKADGALRLTARRASLRLPGLSLRSNAAIETTLEREKRDAPLRGVASATFDDLVMTSGGERSKPIEVRFRTDDLKLDPSQPLADGHVEVRAARVDGLLPLLVGFAPLRSLLAGALGLEDLEATTRFKLGASSNRVDLLSAKSGGVRARGYVESLPGHAFHGRVLLSTRLANLGVRIDSGRTSIEPLVSDDWLDAGATTMPAPTMPRPRAATRSMLSGDPGPRASIRAAESQPPGRAPRRPSSRAP